MVDIITMMVLLQEVSYNYVMDMCTMMVLSQEIYNNVLDMTEKQKWLTCKPLRQVMFQTNVADLSVP